MNDNFDLHEGYYILSDNIITDSGSFTKGQAIHVFFDEDDVYAMDGIKTLKLSRSELTEKVKEDAFTDKLVSRMNASRRFHKDISIGLISTSVFGTALTFVGFIVKKDHPHVSRVIKKLGAASVIASLIAGVVNSNSAYKDIQRYEGYIFSQCNQSDKED